MFSTKIAKIIGVTTVVAVSATATFAFTGPSNNPGDANSSAGSLINQMAGSGFNTATDSLEAIRNKIDSMPFTFSGGNVGIGVDSPNAPLDVLGRVIVNDAGQLEIGTHDIGSQTDLILNANAMISSQGSLRFGVESGGNFLWYNGVNNHSTGTAGGSVKMTLSSSGDLTVAGNISGSRMYGVQWGDISGRPSGLDAGIGAVTSGKWCRGNGSQVTCDQSAPSGSQWSTVTQGIQYGSKVGIGMAPSAIYDGYSLGLGGSLWIQGNIYKPNGNLLFHVDGNKNFSFIDGGGGSSVSVGIGTSSPSQKLHVVNGKIQVDNEAGGQAGIGMAGSWIGDHYDGILHVRSGGYVVAMDGGDRLGIGTTSPGELLEIAQNGGNAVMRIHHPGRAEYKIGIGNNESGLRIVNANGGGEINTYDKGVIIHETGNVSMGTVSQDQALNVDGNVRANSFQQSSDARLKTGVETISDALAKVEALRGVNFTWLQKEDGSEPDEKGVQMGLIAQEVEEIIPEVVMTNDNGYKSVKYANLVAVLIEAVKELEAEKDAEIANLQAQIDELRALVK